jgi:hypothetical protein
MQVAWMRVAAAVAAFVVAPAALGATAQERVEYRAALSRASDDYNAAMKKCRAASGDARTLCRAEAKRDLRRAEAEAQARYRDTPRARLDARVAEANADYAVAKVKCRTNKTGDERRACIKSARAVQQDAIAEAMRESH